MENRKLEITQRLVEQLPNLTVDEAMRTWWLNLRRDGGYRLTYHGYTMFRDVFNLSFWSVEIKDVHNHMLLKLDKKLNWPYYIDGKKRKLIFFSSREAMMATLYGDVKTWLESLR